MPTDTPLAAQLQLLVTDLYYPSESDEPITVVQFQAAAGCPPTAESLRAWLMRPADTPVTEQPPARFWEPVTTDEDWFTDEERARTDRFRQLQALVDAQLTEQRLFRVGDTEITVLLLGLPATGASGDWLGLRTLVVET